MRFRFISLGEEQRGFSKKTNRSYDYRELRCYCIDTDIEIYNKKIFPKFYSIFESMVEGQIFECDAKEFWGKHYPEFNSINEIHIIEDERSRPTSRNQALPFNYQPEILRKWEDKIDFTPIELQDIILSLIYQIEERKMLQFLPNRCYATINDIITEIGFKRKELIDAYLSNSLTGFVKKNLKLDNQDLDNEEGINLIIDELLNSKKINILSEDVPELLFRTISDLTKNGKIIIFPSNKLSENTKSSELPEFSKIRIRSKILELLRLIPNQGFLQDITFNPENDDILQHKPEPQFVFSKRIIEEKLTPPREITIEDLKKYLKSAIRKGKDCPLSDKVNFHYNINLDIFDKAIDTILDSLNDLHGDNFCFSEFQQESIVQILLSAFNSNLFCDTCNNKQCVDKLIDMRKRHVAITAPTGAGKTLAYIIAPLIHIMYYRLLLGDRYKQVPSCIILVPRKDLALDLRQTNIGQIIQILKNKKYEVTLEIDAFGKEHETDVIDRYKNDIVITNIESFKKRLFEPTIIDLLDTRSLKFFIIDEIHLFKGITGTNTSMLMSRFWALLFSKMSEPGIDRNDRRPIYFPIFIGASATIAKIREHIEKVFSLNTIHFFFDQKRLPNSLKRQMGIKVIRAENFSKSVIGRFHHILIKPGKMVHKIGGLTNLISFCMHNYPDDSIIDYYSDPSEEKIRNISKALLFIDSKPNLRISRNWFSQVERRRAIIENSDSSSREIFLRSYIQEKPADIQNCEISSIFQSELNISPCNFCKSLFSSSISLEDWLKNAQSIEITNPKLGTHGILNQCPYYQERFCWYFAWSWEPEKHSDYLISDITSQRGFSLDSIQSLYYDSDKSQKMVSKKMGSNTDLSSLFKLKNNTIARIIMTTPVLEVGVSLPKVDMIFTCQAIRDLASYKQKVGRGGRELFSDIPAFTIITNNSKDRQIMRTPQMIRERDFIEPVTLDESNSSILKWHVVFSIIDYISNVMNISSNKQLFTIVPIIKDLKKIEAINSDELVNIFKLLKKEVTSYILRTFKKHKKDEFIKEIISDIFVILINTFGGYKTKFVEKKICENELEDLQYKHLNKNEIKKLELVIKQLSIEQAESYSLDEKIMEIVG